MKRQDTETQKQAQTDVHTHMTNRKLIHRQIQETTMLQSAWIILIDEHCEGVFTVLLQRVWK